MSIKLFNVIFILHIECRCSPYYVWLNQDFGFLRCLYGSQAYYLQQALLSICFLKALLSIVMVNVLSILQIEASQQQFQPEQHWHSLLLLLILVVKLQELTMARSTTLTRPRKDLLSSDKFFVAFIGKEDIGMLQ